MKRFSSVLLFTLVCMLTFAEPFYVRVNSKDNYATSPTGKVDFQGRTQYAAMCVPLKAGDLLTCYDAENGAEWAITVNDVGDTWGAKGFTIESYGLKCSVAGSYDIYIKLQYEDDCWYIEGPKSDCTAAKPVDPGKPIDPVNPGKPDDGKYTTSAPSQYQGVMLQAFYWDSYTDKGYGRTKWFDFVKDNAPVAKEMGDWFDLIWLPPSAQSTGGTGYLPRNYSNQSSDWGKQSYLTQLIDTLHHHGARVVADMVVNHVAGDNGWCSFAKLDFGEYGTFTPDASWICKTDEVNSDPNAGSCKGKATGAADDGYGDEANYGAGRDWDHNNSKVRDMIKAYGKWLINVIGYDGFRYDYCKGFHNSHINDYNSASKAFFSVMEYWDGNPDVLLSRLNDAGYNTCTFDFGVKYAALNEGIAAGNYGGCKGAGLLGRGKSRYSVTFVDSHDSFQRDNNEFMGAGNSMKNYDGKTMQANAYILCMPGTPCVSWPHWVTWKEDIKKIINARYKTGVHNESSVTDEAGSGYYKATINGTEGELRLLIGPNSGYNSTPSGYTLAAKGTNWGVYYKQTGKRGNKNEERKPIRISVPTNLESVEEAATVAPAAKKFIENGKLLIEVDGVRYDVMGHKL